MIRRAPEGNRCPERGEAGEQECEPHGVLDHEPLRDQVLIRVPIGKLGLNAGDVGPEAGQGDGRLAQLEGIRLVLGVEDGREFTLRQGQAVVQDLRLRSRFGRRNEDELELVSAAGIPDSLDGRLVVRLEKKFDIETVGRIFEPTTLATRCR